VSLDNHLVVLAKAPRLGTVKRRLAADIGPVRATVFYRRTLAALLRRLGRDRRWRLWLAVTPDAAVPTMRPWLPPGARAIPQGRGDLGARMGRMFEILPPGPAVIVGADIPGIDRRHVARAFAALGAADAVFGPATDGGYWLVGARRRRPLPCLFAEVRWSTEHALADTLANLPPGAGHALVDILDDVDDGAALARVTHGSGGTR